MVGAGTLEHFVFRAEQQIALLDRVLPVNAEAERARLLLAWRSGHKAAPHWQFASTPCTELRHALARLAGQLEHADFQERLVAARLRELDLEAALVETQGSPAFQTHARQRFVVESVEAEQLAQTWLRAAAGNFVETRHLSDDVQDPHSLLRVIQCEVGERRLPLAVIVRAQTPSAAVGEGFVAVAQGQWLTPRAALRIAKHELDGHVLPRISARKQRHLALRVGTAGGSEDEEGRAIWLEAQAELLDGERRRELALRHGACLDLRQGADFINVVEGLLAKSCPVEEALPIAERIFRGGGLGREGVYLPAYLRVQAAFRAQPGLERWLRAGRVSVAAALELERRVHDL